MSMQQQLIWTLGAIGVLTMIGVFASSFRRGEGLGPLNLRAVGLVLIGTFAALLAAQGGSALPAGFGVIGAIAGYIFGLRGTEAS